MIAYVQATWGWVPAYAYCTLIGVALGAWLMWLFHGDARAAHEHHPRHPHGHEPHHHQDHF